MKLECQAEFIKLQRHFIRDLTLKSESDRNVMTDDVREPDHT